MKNSSIRVRTLTLVSIRTLGQISVCGGGFGELVRYIAKPMEMYHKIILKMKKDN